MTGEPKTPLEIYLDPRIIEATRAWKPIAKIVPRPRRPRRLRTMIRRFLNRLRPKSKEQRLNEAVQRLKEKAPDDWTHGSIAVVEHLGFITDVTREGILLFNPTSRDGKQYTAQESAYILNFGGRGLDDSIAFRCGRKKRAIQKARSRFKSEGQGRE